MGLKGVARFMFSGFERGFFWKKAQVTIFIIVAILAVAGVALYFILSSGAVSQKDLSPELQPVEKGFLECVREETRSGISILESRGGYIELPEFERGSRYMPFSSQLDFFGTPVPYWHYVSGNNIEKEQIPSKTSMENQLASFIEGNIVESCDLTKFREQGYEVRKGDEPRADVEIKENQIQVNLEMDLAIRGRNQSAIVDKHTKSVDSNLGSLYDSAKEIYNYERKNHFLEDYGVDVLNSYAPVSGIELSCAPKTWNADKIFDRLERNLESNTLALGNDGQSDEYYNVDLPVSKEVRFLTFSDWPSTFEVEPSEGSTLVANPLGDERGLGSLGFCFVNYNFVYDMKYPVMVQVSEGEETFQFPVDVVIEGNTARGPENGSFSSGNVENTGICQNRDTSLNVKTLDLDGNPINASVRYSCLGDTCRIGETSSEGTLKADFPQCTNGFVTSRAEGYVNAREQVSTLNGNKTVSLYMKETSELSLDVLVDGGGFSGRAVVNFDSEDVSRTVTYPQNKKVELSEGFYNISAYVYENTSIKFEDVSSQQCVEVPTGVAGLTNERCFNLDVPSGVSQKALTAGGSTQKVFLESDLENSGTIEIDAPSLPEPNSLEGLRSNYNEFESKSIGVSFK